LFLRRSSSDKKKTSKPPNWPETRRSQASSKLTPEIGNTSIRLKNPENLTEKQKTSFGALLATELKTTEAYGLKQVFPSFFEQETVDQAHDFFIDWYDEVQKRSVPAMKRVAHTLAKNLPGLLGAVKWKLTNAYAESINAAIQEVNTVARGYRRFQNFRIAILFFLGKLGLSPQKCR
jgi:transposase